MRRHLLRRQFRARFKISLLETNRLLPPVQAPRLHLVIPKCGCTFVTNLLWRLEHGNDHDQPIRVHDDDNRFLRADALGLNAADIRGEAHAFTVLSNPVSKGDVMVPELRKHVNAVYGADRRRFEMARDAWADGAGQIPRRSDLEV